MVCSLPCGLQVSKAPAQASCVVNTEKQLLNTASNALPQQPELFEPATLCGICKTLRQVSLSDHLTFAQSRGPILPVTFRLPMPRCDLGVPYLGASLSIRQQPGRRPACVALLPGDPEHSAARIAATSLEGLDPQWTWSAHVAHAIAALSTAAE